MIYLNCAATSHQRPECVIDAVADALRTFGSCGRGAHESELAAARSIALAREPRLAPSPLRGSGSRPFSALATPSG